MGTTPNRAIPYVEPGDTVQIYPAAMKSQSDRIDTVLGADSGWVAVGISAGFAAHTEAPMVRKIGNIVYIRGAWAATGIGTAASYSVGTIPAGFRPIVGVLGRVGTDAGPSNAGFIINTAGAVQIRTGSGHVASASYYISGYTWLTD